MIAVYCITRGRLELTRKSLKMLREWAGIPIRLYVVDNGSDSAMLKYLREEKSKGNIHWLHIADRNLGQNIAANMALDEILSTDAEWILRWDSDALPRSRRFLKKMHRIAERFVDAGIVPILSPEISKLKYPPEAMAAGDDIGVEYHVVQVLGGICRLHHRVVFDGWRFNRFGALGFGEAHEMADRAFELNMPKLRLPHLEVEHAYGEDGQAERWPEHFTFENKEIPRYIGYGL